MNCKKRRAHGGNATALRRPTAKAFQEPLGLRRDALNPLLLGLALLEAGDYVAVAEARDRLGKTSNKTRVVLASFSLPIPGAQNLWQDVKLSRPVKRYTYKSRDSFILLDSAINYRDRPGTGVSKPCI